jgi:LCP family protein required for cell wall assembly
MMLVSCDPLTKRVGVISIPRDSRVHIPGHGTDKINAAHALGGPELSVDTVKEVFGVPVDHYMVIDVQGLRKVFEALGPIEVKVEKRMRYQDHAAHLKVALDPGVQVLTPEQAEEYVRFRHDARGDIGRIDRQQWFIRQVSKKLREPQVLLKLPELFKLANEYVVTDLSVEDMAKLATFGKDIQSNQVETATLPGDPQIIRGGSYWVPNEQADVAVFNRLLGTPMSIGQDSTDTGTLSSPNSAIAAENESGAKPISFVLRYPKGFEETAVAFEKELTDAGYIVKYKTKSDPADCAHEELVQCSYRADDAVTQRLRDRLHNISEWPVVVALDIHAPADFTIVLSPDTAAPHVVEKDKEASSGSAGSKDAAIPDVSNAATKVSRTH